MAHPFLLAKPRLARFALFRSAFAEASADTFASRRKWENGRVGSAGVVPSCAVLANNTARRTRPSRSLFHRRRRWRYFTPGGGAAGGVHELACSRTPAGCDPAGLALLRTAGILPAMPPERRRSKKRALHAQSRLSHLQCSASNETSHARDGVQCKGDSDRSNCAPKINLILG
jgi:hypothetical protein